MPASGYFVTFEGPEGSGKSTQVARLAADLRNRGFEVFTTREPGGTPAGEMIRTILLDRRDVELGGWTEALLFTAARAQLVKDIIAPELRAGHIVLCDRFRDSTLAYQGYGRGLDLETLRRLQDQATDGLVPALTFLLDLPVEEGLSRIPPPSLDRLDREAQAFHRRVREGYQDMARQDPGRWVTVNAAESPDVLAELIVATTMERLERAGVRPRERRSA
jgi:dTMP kinase